MPLLHWAVPSKYHSIHKNDLAHVVAQSEQAYLAIAPQDATVKAWGTRYSGKAFAHIHSRFRTHSDLCARFRAWRPERQ